MDLMNSEDHSQVFDDTNDQRDWTVADDSVEVFMQARFRVSPMTDDEVHRNLSILRRRYSSHADESFATLGAPSHLLALSSSDRFHTVSPIRLASSSPVTVSQT
jgi:hypothetical protein